MKRINTYITDAQAEALAALAARTDLTVAELIRRALDRYLKLAK